MAYLVVFWLVVMAEGNDQTLGGITGIVFGMPLAFLIGWYGPRLFERWLP